jgi:hypothetical protein
MGQLVTSLAVTKDSSPPDFFVYLDNVNNLFYKFGCFENWSTSFLHDDQLETDLLQELSKFHPELRHELSRYFDSSTDWQFLDTPRKTIGEEIQALRLARHLAFELNKYLFQIIEWQKLAIPKVNPLDKMPKLGDFGTFPHDSEDVKARWQVATTTLKDLRTLTIFDECYIINPSSSRGPYAWHTDIYLPEAHPGPAFLCSLCGKLPLFFRKQNSARTYSEFLDDLLSFVEHRQESSLTDLIWETGTSEEKKEKKDTSPIATREASPALVATTEVQPSTPSITEAAGAEQDTKIASCMEDSALVSTLAPEVESSTFEASVPSITIEGLVEESGVQDRKMPSTDASSSAVLNLLRETSTEVATAADQTSLLDSQTDIKIDSRKRNGKRSFRSRKKRKGETKRKAKEQHQSALIELVNSRFYIDAGNMVDELKVLSSIDLESY